MVKYLGGFVRVVPLALVLALAACGGAAAPTGTFTKFGDGVEVAFEMPDDAIPDAVRYDAGGLFDSIVLYAGVSK